MTNPDPTNPIQIAHDANRAEFLASVDRAAAWVPYPATPEGAQQFRNDCHELADTHTLHPCAKCGAETEWVPREVGRSAGFNDPYGQPSSPAGWICDRGHFEKHEPDDEPTND